MFDRTIINKSQDTPYDKTITEIKAPTDDSIRLLNEMQDKVSKNIVDRIIVEDNIVNYKCVVFKKDFDLQTYADWVVSINGNEIKGRENIKWRYNNQELIERIYKSVAFKISEYLICNSNLTNP